MSDFAPSVEAARKALGNAVPIETRDHPPGAAGVAFSLDEVAARVRKGRNDPRVRAWAIRAIHAAGSPEGMKQQAQAILDALKKATVYVQDPLNTEFIQAAHETICLDEKGLCFRGGDCFPQDTRLLRDDFELVRIKDIKVGDRIWGFDKWTTVKAVAFKGKLSVDAVFCNNGSVVPLTKDHKVYVARCDRHDKISTWCACRVPERRIERVAVSQLKKKDVLIAPSKLPFGSIDMDVGRALIEGLYVSDGWSEEYRFAISGQDGQPKQKQKAEVQAICERLGIETSWSRKYIRVNDPEWNLRMQQMGSYAPEKHLLTINYVEEAAAATLRGVMADSGANTNGNGRTFTSTSKLLTTQTRVLHRMFGMSCSIRYIENHGGLGSNPIWRLGVRDTSAKQREKLLRVKSVERNVSTVPCYDIQTEDHYVYLPEHDVTVSNCDDLTVAYGAAVLSVGIPYQVVGQSFAFGTPPSHVMGAIQDVKTGEWFQVDPSTNKPVGDFIIAVKEWWIDPMNVNDKTTQSISGSGDFVGVGRLGDVPPLTAAAVTQQVQAGLFDLQSSGNALASAIDQIAQIIKVTGFDPEPATPITGISDFPSGIIWTASMDKIARDFLSQVNFMVSAGQDALNGVRTIYVDATNSISLGALATDTFVWGPVGGVADIIVAIYNKAGTLLGGITSKLGEFLQPAQVIAQAPNAGTLQGPPRTDRGVGSPVIVPIVVGLAVSAVVIVELIVVWSVMSKLANTVATMAREKSYQSTLAYVQSCVASGKCTSQQAADLLNRQRQLMNEAAAQDAKDNPFTSGLDSLTTFMKWLGIGGLIVVGTMVAYPVVAELGHSAADAIRSKRLEHA